MRADVARRPPGLSSGDRFIFHCIASYCRFITHCGLILLGVCGCARLDVKGKSPLAPARMSKDSVVFETFLVTIPYGDAEANGPMWNEIDEQHLPAATRQNLVTDGFRAGLIGGRIPLALEKLMDLQETVAANSDQGELMDVMQDSPVSRRHTQLPPGQPFEIQSSGIYDQLPVIKSDQGQLGGRWFAKAQGCFEVKAWPQADGRTKVSLQPQLQYGDPKVRYNGDGVVAFRPEFARPREVYENLRLEPHLGVGQMLIVTCLPDRPGSLGHYFFTEDRGGKLQQKLLLIRLSQTQQDQLFAPTDKPDAE